MKSVIFLLLSQPFGRDTFIEVTCSISGDADGLRGRSCEFATLSELYEAFNVAGVMDSEMQTPLNVIRCGFSAFLETSSHVARNLGLLSGSPLPGGSMVSDDPTRLKRPEPVSAEIA